MDTKECKRCGGCGFTTETVGQIARSVRCRDCEPEPAVLATPNGHQLWNWGTTFEEANRALRGKCISPQQACEHPAPRVGESILVVETVHLGVASTRSVRPIRCGDLPLLRLFDRHLTYADHELASFRQYAIGGQWYWELEYRPCADRDRMAADLDKAIAQLKVMADENGRPLFPPAGSISSVSPGAPRISPLAARSKLPDCPDHLLDYFGTPEFRPVFQLPLDEYPVRSRYRLKRNAQGDDVRRNLMSDGQFAICVFLIAALTWAAMLEWFT